MDPAALVKAQSLYRFASEQGAPLSTFQLALTVQEGLELIRWFVTEQGAYPNEVLIRDAEIAQCTGNPWGVLEHFNLLGLAIVPLVLN